MSTCFVSTNLMDEFEGKILYIGGLLLLITFTILVTFTKLSSCAFSKVRSYLCNKKFLPQLLHFKNYNSPSNGQKIPIIGT